jgi:parvulin-like peptidyl-prolyl isomerase
MKKLMKRYQAALLLLLLSSALAFGEIDPTVARLRLERVEVITKKQLESQIEKLEKAVRAPLSAEDKRQLLNNLIDTKLLLQAADRDNTRASQAEIDAMVALFKQQLALQGGLNPQMSDAEFERILKQQDAELTWDKFIEQITDQIKVRNYIQKDQFSLFQSVDKPTDQEIQDFYEGNKTSFVSPEMVRFKQIAIQTQGLSEKDAATAKKMADEIFQELESGASFDKYQEIYLEGSRTLIGGIVFDTWRRDDTRKPIEYGKAFFDAVFKMKEGSRSQVLKSNYGYHVIEIIEKIPFMVLDLDDKIPPQRVLTVREYIADALLQSKNNEVFQKATEVVVAKIKEEAEIKIFEDNLPF